MALITELSHLTNPLVSSMQLETSASQLDGVPKVLEESVRFQSAKLVQAAGILLRLPQELIAQAIIMMYRCWIGPDGISMLEHNAKDVAAAALYLTTKPSGTPITPRQVLVVFEYLNTTRPEYRKTASNGDQAQTDWHLCEGRYEAARNKLFSVESQFLRVVGFQTHVALPYSLCINYLQALEIFNWSQGSELAKRAFAHLNAALLSPQLLYLTHQPAMIATASIYLAAKEINLKLPEANWWEVFDVDREGLGFLVVALRSVHSFADRESKARSNGRNFMTIAELRNEIDRN